MKKLLNAKTFLATTALVATLGVGQQAISQTVNVPVNATVQNSLTLAVASPINFGTFAAVDDTTNRATIAINTAGVIASATAGGTSRTASIDAALATVGQITVEDGATGVNINVQIAVPTQPTDGGGSGDTFTITNFTTSYNGAAEVARTAAAAATGFTVLFNSGFGGGVNTLDIGATLETQAAAAVYADGTYAGQIDVTFAY